LLLASTVSIAPISTIAHRNSATPSMRTIGFSGLKVRIGCANAFIVSSSATARNPTESVAR
jgi:hypothetical protein